MSTGVRWGARLSRREMIGLAAATVLACPPAVAQSTAGAPADWPQRLIAAARSQIGVTVHYDPAYTPIAFPGGDIPRERGVCTDVLIRAYRDAFGIDLQALVNADMRVAFSKYPKVWSLKRPDPNIDHRRVLNLAVFFDRRGGRIGVGRPTAEAFAPADIVTMTLPGNLPHIGIVGDRLGSGGRRLVIHNIGAGAEESDILANYMLTGRYRFAAIGGPAP